MATVQTLQRCTTGPDIGISPALYRCISPNCLFRCPHSGTRQHTWATGVLVKHFDQRQSNKVDAHLLAPRSWPCRTPRRPPRGRRRRGWGRVQGRSPTATGACPGCSAIGTVDEGGPDRCDSMQDKSQATMVRPNAPASTCSLRQCAWWVRLKNSGQ